MNKKKTSRKTLMARGQKSGVHINTILIGSEWISSEHGERQIRSMVLLSLIKVAATK